MPARSAHSPPHFFDAAKRTRACAMWCEAPLPSRLPVATLPSRKALWLSAARVFSLSWLAG